MGTMDKNGFWTWNIHKKPNLIVAICYLRAGLASHSIDDLILSIGGLGQQFRFSTRHG